MLSSRAISRAQIRLSLSRSLSLTHTRFRKLTEPEYDEAELMREKLDKQTYYAKREKTEESDSSPEELRRFQRIEVIKGLISGLFTIGGLVGTYALYANWAKISAWWYNDGLIDFEIPKTRKKKWELPVVTNKNDSSVPGLYIWGDNSQFITSLDPSVGDVRYPMRHDWFDGKKLRSVELGGNSALAIDANGDLIQWGRGFNGGCIPEYTVKGEKLIQAKLSGGTIYALNKKKELLVIPEKKEDQEAIPGSVSRNWLFSKMHKGFTKLDTSLFNKGEKIESFDAGREHLTVLTNIGRAFTSATGFSQLKKSRGQFGIPQFSHFKSPPPPNKLFEISLLNQNVQFDSKNKVDSLEPRVISKICCGDFHTLALDENGELFSFGQNTYGQLGHPVTYETEFISYPKKVTQLSKHIKKSMFPEVLDIHTGGDTSFCVVKPVPMYQLIRGKHKEQLDGEELTVGFGKNLKGQIGNGLFIHGQADPVRLKEFDKFEDFDESTGSMVRIGVAEWSTGAEHTFVKLCNGDVLFWGANDFAQLGNGKKYRVPKPSNPPALVEPSYTKDTYKDLTFVNRLQLGEQQHVVAGVTASAVFTS